MDPNSYVRNSSSGLTESYPKGTLVKITISQWGGPPTFCLGIVLDTTPKNNDILFPSAMVYNLETKKITREFLGTLKVVSKVD